MIRSHGERHQTERVGWLRATVLGENGPVNSILLIGVAREAAMALDTPEAVR